MERAVSIFYSGDDPLDTNFANRIASDVRRYARPFLVNTDELDRMYDRGEEHPEHFKGAAVFILSPSMMKKEWNRLKLINSAPQLGWAGHTAFYICRGMSFSGTLLPEEILDWQALLTSLKNPASPDKERLREFLDETANENINNWNRNTLLCEDFRISIINALNGVLEKRDFYDSGALCDMKLNEETKGLLRVMDRLGRSDIQRLNRLLLESMYPKEIQKSIASFHDLDELIDKVMIGNENDLPVLLKELRDYVSTFRKNRFSLMVNFSVFFLIALIITSANLFFRIYFLSFLAPVILIYCLLAASSLQHSWETGLAYISLFALGFRLNLLPACDFWPWLGRRWQLPELEPHFNLHMQSDSTPSKSWLSLLCSLPAEKHILHSQCSPEELKWAIQAWLGTLRRTFARQVFILPLLLVPAAVTLKYQSWLTAATGAAPLLLGLLFPPLYYWAAYHLEQMSSNTEGISREHLQWTDELYESHHPGICKILPWARMRDIALEQFSDSPKKRAWLPLRDNAFISYAWADENDKSIAPHIAGVFKDIGVDFFYDREDIQEKFSAWRSLVSKGLLNCTHLFIVIGKKVHGGRVINREARFSLQRWGREFFPAILCVVNPSDAEALLKDTDLPIELRFILECCPRLTLDQIRDSETVRHILCQRRRQGLLRDWFTLVFPEYDIRKFLISEGCVKHYPGKNYS